MSEELNEENVPETQPEVQPEDNGTASAAAVAETPHKGFFGKIDKWFGITKSGSNYKTEIIAGLTTFMAMVYILMVNPGMFQNVIGGDNPFGASYIATAIGAIVGTLLMAFLAKMPLAQASGMGVNAFVVYTLVLSSGLSYPNAMVFTLLDGVIFIILSATGLRKYIFKAIPDEVRKAINVGLGLFIAFIGLQNATAIVNDNSTLVSLASFNVLSANFATYSAGSVSGILPALVAMLGVVLIAILSKKKVKGAILWGILGSTALYFIMAGFGCLAGGADLVSATFAESQFNYTVPENLLPYISTAFDPISGANVVNITNMPFAEFTALIGEVPQNVVVSHFYTNGLACKQIFSAIANQFTFNPFSAFAAWGKDAAGKVFYEGFDFSGYLGVQGHNVGSLVLLIITSALSLCMLDMFDTIGTLYGACEKGGLLDKEGNPLNMNKCMLSDAVATTVGAIAGTSTVTTFVESSAGVAAGGKTGFTALVTGLCFIVAMFLSPIAQLIPSAATATALIWVGVLMMSSVTNIEWTDPAKALPAFLTIAVMAFGYEISYGIGIGMISSLIIKVCTGKIKEISVVTWIITIFFLATFILTH